MSAAPNPESKAKQEKPARLRELLPEVWVFIKPRRGLLAVGFAVMAINRVAGLILPASTKYLVDDVILKRHLQMLVPLVLAVVGATAVQGITSFTLTQLLSKEAQRLIAELRRKVQAHVGRLPQHLLKTLTATSLMGLASSTLLGIVSALIMFLGARQIVGGGMTLGSFLEYTIFLGLLVGPVFQIVDIGTDLTEAVAGLERTREILSERPEDEDPGRSVALGPIRGDVTFENVTFAYDAGKTVLEGITFTAEPGTVTALVGPSGAGKSTMIGLIAAFYVPTAGTVRVDGVDLATVRLDSYRTQIGVVLQDTFLFDGTIRENVAFSRPDAAQDEILAACRIARVDEFAEAFDNKYETIVGERGVKLSGGQKQRVSIARAILADPRILILDEATSSLDSESEALIQEGLSYLMRGRTTFVIAHRLSTVRRADQILVVEAGRIVERGTHGSLYAAEGRYYELYTRQHGLEANLFLAPGEGEPKPELAEEAETEAG